MHLSCDQKSLSQTLSCYNIHGTSVALNLRNTDRFGLCSPPPLTSSLAPSGLLSLVPRARCRRPWSSQPRVLESRGRERVVTVEQSRAPARSSCTGCGSWRWGTGRPGGGGAGQGPGGLGWALGMWWSFLSARCAGLEQSSSEKPFLCSEHSSLGASLGQEACTGVGLSQPPDVSLLYPSLPHFYARADLGKSWSQSPQEKVFR